MTRFDENQKNISNYEKNSFSYRYGNSKVHFHKGPDGRLIQVERPAFIKIKKLE
jgi:hypothetical protein